MSLAENAKTVLKTIEEGQYFVGGSLVDIQSSISYTRNHSRLYTPEQLKFKTIPSGQDCIVSLRGQTTQEATFELTQESQNHVALLNFASARNPGGGFLKGARAQEEDLCRCSVLYDSLLLHPTYYSINRKQRSMLYSDHMIFSPKVCFFKTNGRGPLLQAPFYASVLTIPAPNTGPYQKKQEGPMNLIEATFLRRWSYILAVAHAQECDALVLGAWGCGAFQGDPKIAAQTACTAIKKGTGCVRHIRFAIPQNGKKSQNNFLVFQKVLQEEGFIEQ